MIVRAIAQQSPPGFASCTCGWSVSRPTEAGAIAAGQVHAAGHRSRGESASLPIIPIAPRAWSSEAA